MNENDELVALRGKGRYFGTEEQQKEVEEVPLCHKCQEPGHLAHECTALICDSCGKRNAHITKECPERSRCSNCMQFGHKRNTCPNKHVNNHLPCSQCGSRIHNDSTCPCIWRFYKLKDDSDSHPHYPKIISCYNCGDATHYGDECPMPRPIMLKYRERSCFSVDNLERSLHGRYYKELDRFKEVSRRKKTDLRGRFGGAQNDNRRGRGGSGSGGGGGGGGGKKGKFDKHEKRGPRMRRGEKRDRRFKN